MKLGVLETGAPPGPLQVQFGSYPQMFQALLGDGFDWRVFDVQRGEWPASPEDQDAYIVTGSSCGVYDGDPWIGPLMEFLRAARGKAGLIGVCFGHQAMAQAFGGQVIKSPKGWGVGLHVYDVIMQETWMDGAGSIAIPASHQDQVVEPPPGARVLAANAFTPYGMLDYGEGAFSIQLHPEFEPDYAAALIESRREFRFTDEQAGAALASLRRPNDNRRFGGWIRAFLSR